MKEEITNYVGKAPRITGTTIINHAIRTEMRIGFMEYVLMDAITKLLSKGKLITDVEVYILTGMHPDDQISTMNWLIEKGFVYPETDEHHRPVLTGKWESFFAGAEAEFEEFWKKDGKNCWTGSKPEALKLYKDLRKNFTKKFLFQQRDNYFWFLELQKEVKNFDQAKMMCSVFLGKKERYNEEWHIYIKDLEAQKKAKEFPQAAEMKPSTTTIKDREKKYEDTNQ